MTEKYGIFSYPSIALFWQGMDHPIFFRKERSFDHLSLFLSFRLKGLQAKVKLEDLQKLPEEQRALGILFHGEIDSKEFNATSVLSFLE